MTLTDTFLEFTVTFFTFDVSLKIDAWQANFSHVTENSVTFYWFRTLRLVYVPIVPVDLSAKNGVTCQLVQCFAWKKEELCIEWLTLLHIVLCKIISSIPNLSVFTPINIFPS
jgi:hypothetical protein